VTAVEGWKKYKVRDICELGRGRVISGQEIERNPGVFPVYSSQSSNNGKMGAIDTFDFDGEYVTWTTDGAYAGTVFYRSGKFNCTNVCGTLRAKDPDISMAFIAYILSTLAKDHVSYVGNPKLMNGVMANIEFTIPSSKPEQTKIAEILSTVDRAIEQTDVLIAKQQRIKTGLMQDLLTRGIDEHGNLRSGQTHPFKDSPLGRIPVEWEVEKWSQVCSKIQDGTHFSPRTDSSAEFKYVTSKNVKFGFLDLSDVEYIDKRQHDEIYKRCNVYFGDVLLTKDGANTGNAAINFLNEEFSLLSSVALLRPLESKLTSIFLLQTILSESGQRLIKDAMSGLAITRVTLEIINNLLMKVPPIKEQKSIGRFLAVQDERIKSEAKKLAKLRFLKIALMQDLLTGKVRVTSLLDKEEKVA